MHCTTPSFYIDPIAPPPKSNDAQDAPRLCEELVHRSDVVLVDVVREHCPGKAATLGLKIEILNPQL